MRAISIQLCQQTARGGQKGNVMADNLIRRPLLHDQGKLTVALAAAACSALGPANEADNSINPTTHNWNRPPFSNIHQTAAHFITPLAPHSLHRPNISVN